MIAGTTAGIEPMFALAFTRAILGRHLLEVNPCFDRMVRDRGFYSEELLAEIARRGGVRAYPQLPADVRAAFPVAAEIAPEWHLRMQAAVQRHVDAAVSKTVNLPATATATVDDVRRIYLAAWTAKVKGITVSTGTAAARNRCCRTPPPNPRWPRRAPHTAAAAPGGCASSDRWRAVPRSFIGMTTVP